MTSLDGVVARLRNYNARLSGKAVAEGLLLEEAFIAGAASAEEAFVEESIVLRTLRPVLAIRDDVAELAFERPEDAKLWTEPLEAAREMLVAACRAVGRIELRGHEEFEWIGTGWLVAPDVIVTNRHVALEFSDPTRLTFRMGDQGRIGADVDFRQEFGSDSVRLFSILKVLHIEPLGGPDLAFFQVALTSPAGELAAPIRLASSLSDGRKVAVIGYPARDSRIPDLALMDQIYGNLYDKKRLAPGDITRVESARLLHTCTTLGGNSGSVVLDLESGVAQGLHFSGRFLGSNYAVRADTVARRLAEVRSGQARSRSAPSPERTKPREAPLRRRGSTPAGNASATLTLPLTVTFSIGTPSATSDGQSLRAQRPRRPVARRTVDVPDDIAEEARPADYANRPGYSADFLGADFVVELPAIDAVSDDVLSFDTEDGEETVLRYEHFSVVMSASRRMCYFSATNIDGALSRRTKRAGWRTDPRIPKAAQIIGECYGSPPKFSRGHMTRREDPAWGNARTAQRGNVDSMHVTNATPQMQAFNSPIWLELEDYALQNARDDDMKVSVFTGPYFDYDGIEDPVIDGVSIPRVFWKIIAFVHDETGQPCATGYEMSQEENLPTDEEFVFGDFTSSHTNLSTQVSIASIEERTGLGFGDLSALDPLGDANEAVGGVGAPLERLEQIRFR